MFIGLVSIHETRPCWMPTQTDLILFKCIRKEIQERTVCRAIPPSPTNTNFLLITKGQKKKWGENERGSVLSTFHAAYRKLPFRSSLKSALLKNNLWSDTSGDRKDFLFRISWIYFPRDTELVQEVQEQSNQNPTKTRSDQHRMSMSVSSPTSPCCLYELKPMMLRTLRGEEETSQPCHMQHNPRTAQLVWKAASVPLPLPAEVQSLFRWYLVLRVSRQIGRYLSNKMVRLALSDWISRLSIQLLTGGFQPRSDGLIYRIPLSPG